MDESETEFYQNHRTMTVMGLEIGCRRCCRTGAMRPHFFFDLVSDDFFRSLNVCWHLIMASLSETSLQVFRSLSFFINAPPLAHTL